jgi:hypothetical protein
VKNERFFIVCWGRRAYKPKHTTEHCKQTSKQANTAMQEANTMQEEENSVMFTTEEGDQVWVHRNDWTMKHRENDLPAVIYATGSQEWYVNGVLHRDNDLPAIIRATGTRMWYRNGVKHRDPAADGDGGDSEERPAVIWACGDQEWWQNGTLHRENDLPAMILADGTRKWYQNGLLHRENDLPAIVYANGDLAWFRKGLLHRENDLPAVIKAEGRTLKWHERKHEWYQMGVLLDHRQVRDRIQARIRDDNTRKVNIIGAIVPLPLDVGMVMCNYL